MNISLDSQWALLKQHALEDVRFHNNDTERIVDSNVKDVVGVQGKFLIAAS